MCNPEFRTIGNLPAFFGIIGTLPVVCEGSDPSRTIGKSFRYYW